MADSRSAVRFGTVEHDDWPIGILSIRLEVPRPTEVCVPKKNDFPDTAKEIVQAIIEGDDQTIAQALDPNFRFKTRFDPDFSASLSEAFAVLLARARSKTTDSGRVASLEKRSNKADTYAIDVFNEVEKLKSENGDVSTLRKAAALLTEKGVKTPTGKGEWHAATLIPLQKRWQKLGLVPDEEKPKL